MPQTGDADILAAALIGYQEKLKEIDARMADLRRRLGGKSAAPAAPAAAATAKRAVSAKARKRMAAAQRRRWAAVRRAQAAAAVKPAASRPAAKEAKPAAASKRVVKKGAARKAKPAVAPKSAAQPKRQPARVKRAAVKRSAAESARTPKAAPAPQPEAGAPPVVAEERPPVRIRGSVSVTSRTLSRCLSAPCHLDNSTRTAPERDSHARLGFTLGVLSEIEFALRRINNLRGTFCLLNVCKLAPFFWGPPESLEMDKIGKTAPCGSPASGDRWSLYISLMTFIGISPVGALESSPWRKPWGQKRTARSPIGRKNHSRRVIDLRARSAFLRPYGAGAFPDRSHRAYALGYFLSPLTGLWIVQTQD